MPQAAGRSAPARGAFDDDDRSDPLIVTPSHVLRPAALAGRAAPKSLLRLGLAVAPRRLAGRRAVARLVLEKPVARYLIALSPFPMAMIVWPELALPISQAPLLMLIIVLFIETSVISIGSPERRRSLVDRAEVARGLDLLSYRARDALVRIAARRGLTTGVLHLVVEQSAMARVRPFTLVSIQAEEDGSVLDLDAEEAALIREGLFDSHLTERRLHRINTATETFLRATALDARSVSAHARLEALDRMRGPST